MSDLNFPPRGEWLNRQPESLGFDRDDLARACNFASSSEIDWPTNVSTMVAVEDPPPYNEIIGPTKPRGEATGVVVKDGYVAATWGTPTRVDMTFSATKSYLATCAGLALDRGLIADVDEPVVDSVPGDWFASTHNRQITWRQLLQQTSEWSGTLFGIPDTVDHNRSVGRRPEGPRKGEPRRLRTPGTFWEYNDVRVNALGLAALYVWREPLAGVLRRQVMDPIGATETWEWHPYRNAYVEIAGRSLPSVPGGAHWGGGLWISAYDHARFGLLMLGRGRWNDTQILSTEWIDAALTPCEQNPRYGFMWWLNPDRKPWSAASENAFAAIGAGGNLVFVSPEHNLVVVTRWAGDPNGVVERVINALR